VTPSYDDEVKTGAFSCMYEDEDVIYRCMAQH